MLSVNSLESSIVGPSHRSWTRLSSVVGFSDDRSKAATGSYYLEGIARAVSRLKLQRCRPEDFQDPEVVGGGETFKVVKTQYQQSVVAVKYVRIHDESENDIVQRRLRSVLQEIVIMHHQPLAAHDNILNILGYGWDISNGVPLPYVVVEYGEGGSLRDWLKKRVSVHYDTKRSIINDVASALDAVHKCQLIHGDMKLDNIIAVISPDKPDTVIAKIADFGHSIVHVSDDREKNRYLGTTLYNAPEVQKQKHSPIPPEKLFKCDIWSYGLLAWEVLQDGDRFFKPIWAMTKDLERKCGENCALLTSPTSKTTSAVCTVHSVSADVEDVFGNFDVAYLRHLVFVTLSEIYFNLIADERKFLKNLFLETLHADPGSRKLDTALKRLSGCEETTLPPRVMAAAPVELRTSELDIEVFQRAGNEDLIWECQQRILRDFEEASNASTSSQQSLDAALRTGLCYLSGFGTSCSYQKAMTSFEKLAFSSNPISELFLSRNGSGQQKVSSSCPQAMYTKFLVRKYRQRLLFTSIGRSGDQSSPLDVGSSLHGKVTEEPELQSDISWTFCRNTRNSCPLGSENERSITGMLSSAIYQADFPRLEGLVRANATEVLNMCDDHGDTPLLLACKLGNSDMVKLLLEHGADPTLQFGEGCTVYHWLFCLEESLWDLEDLLFRKIRSSHEIVNRLCSCRHSLHEQWPLPLGGSPLAFAVTTGSQAAVDLLLKHGANPLLPAYFMNDSDDDSLLATPVHLAIRFCLPRITHLLVQAVHIATSKPLGDRPDSNSVFDPASNSSSVGINVKENSLAVAIGFSSLLELYFIHGSETQASIKNTVEALPVAWLTSVTTSGWTALSAAILGNNVTVVSELLSLLPQLAQKSIPDPLDASKVVVYPVHLAARRATQNAAANNSIEILEAVVKTDREALIRKDGRGYSVLHTCVMTSSLAVTRWLIAVGADVNATIDVSGETPLMLARSTELLELLLSHGANIDCQDLSGYSGVSHLLSTGRKDLTLRLQKAGIDTKKAVLAAMFICARSDDVASMQRILYSHSLPINERDEEGNTPLMIATKSGCPDMVAWLLSLGADWFKPGSSGLSAPQLAIRTSQPRARDVLEAYLYHFREDAPVEHGWIFMCQLAADPHQIALEALNYMLFDKRLPTILHGQNIRPFFIDVSGLVKHNMRERMQRGDTPLHIAAETLNLEAVKALLKSDLHMNTARDDGTTPLMLAFGNGPPPSYLRQSDLHSQICSLLLTHEYDYHSSVKTWNSALSTRHFSLVEYILTHVSTSFLSPPPDESFVLAAMEVGRTELVVTACLRGLLRPQGLFLPSLQRTFRQAPWFANVPEESPYSESILALDQHPTGIIVYDLPNMRERWTYEIFLLVSTDGGHKLINGISPDETVHVSLRRMRKMTETELKTPGIASFTHVRSKQVLADPSMSLAEQEAKDDVSDQPSDSNQGQAAFSKRCVDKILGKRNIVREENVTFKKRKVGGALDEKIRRGYLAKGKTHVTSSINFDTDISSLGASLPKSLVSMMELETPISREWLLDEVWNNFGEYKRSEPRQTASSYNSFSHQIPYTPQTTADSDEIGTSKYYQKLEAEGEAQLFDLYAIQKEL